MAKEITESILSMLERDEISLKVLIYRRSNETDPYMHDINVCGLSMALAQEIELEDFVTLDVGLGALLQDIGFHLYGSSSSSESAVLTLEDKELEWEHPILGAEILLATPGLPDLVPVVAYEHHIHYDGGGYPQRVRHRDLNIASMITCITNSYDNLRRDRPRHDALSLVEAIDWMDRRFGTHFHPLLFKKFRALVKARAKAEI
jgi:HD-GYP domain-containing protein (c-di-GMP phosphodiesterase class II)